MSENALEVATDFTGELHRHRGHESTMAAAMGTQAKASCTRRGWLDKKPSSGLGGSWKRRWVVLTQNSAEAKISWYAGVRRAASARGARRIALGLTTLARMRPRDSRLTTQVAHGARMLACPAPNLRAVPTRNPNGHALFPRAEASDYPHNPKGEFKLRDFKLKLPGLGGDKTSPCATVKTGTEGFTIMDGKVSLSVGNTAGAAGRHCPTGWLASRLGVGWEAGAWGTAWGGACSGAER